MKNTKTNSFINAIKNVLKNQKNLAKESEWIQFLKDIESHVLQKDNGWH